MHWSGGYHALITWLLIHWSRGWSCTDPVADHTLIMKLIIHWSRDCMHWSHDFACTDHVDDHALINHVLVTWLSCTDHVAIIHWSPGWSCTDHMADDALITLLIMIWSRGCASSGHVSEWRWSCDWSYSDHLPIMHWWCASGGNNQSAEQDLIKQSSGNYHWPQLWRIMLLSWQ